MNGEKSLQCWTNCRLFAEACIIIDCAKLESFLLRASEKVKRGESFDAKQPAVCTDENRTHCSPSCARPRLKISLNYPLFDWQKKIQRKLERSFNKSLIEIFSRLENDLQDAKVGKKRKLYFSWKAIFNLKMTVCRIILKKLLMESFYAFYDIK